MTPGIDSRENHFRRRDAIVTADRLVRSRRPGAPGGAPRGCLPRETGLHSALVEQECSALASPASPGGTDTGPAPSRPSMLPGLALVIEVSIVLQATLRWMAEGHVDPDGFFHVKYLHRNDPALQRLHRRLFDGRLSDPENALPRFDSRYLLVRQGRNDAGSALVRRVKGNPAFETLFENATFTFFEPRAARAERASIPQEHVVVDGVTPARAGRSAPPSPSQASCRWAGLPGCPRICPEEVGCTGSTPLLYVAPLVYSSLAGCGLPGRRRPVERRMDVCGGWPCGSWPKDRDRHRGSEEGCDDAHPSRGRVSRGLMNSGRIRGGCPLMESQKTLSWFEWLIFALSIFVVGELYVENIIEYSPAVASAIEVVDFAICVLFLAEFAFRLVRAPAKWRFIAWNWLDLVGSIPFVGPLRIARLARIARVLRLVRSGRVIFSFVHRNKAVSTFRTVLILNIALILLAAIAIYHVEHGESANFATIGETIWWSLVAVTTLSFDGATPVTLEGKVFALFLVAGGVLLFGTFIGMVADYFVGEEDVLREMRSINSRLDRIEQSLSRISGREIGREFQASSPGSGPVSGSPLDADPEAGDRIERSC